MTNRELQLEWAIDDAHEIARERTIEQGIDDTIMPLGTILCPCGTDISRYYDDTIYWDDILVCYDCFESLFFHDMELKYRKFKKMDEEEQEWEQETEENPRLKELYRNWRCTIDG